MTPLTDFSLAERAIASPETLAVVDAATGVAWTFARLHQLAQALTPRLAARARGADAPVVLAAGTSLGTFLVFHTLLAAGMPFLPLHPRLTQPERAALAEAAGVDPGEVLDDVAIAALLDGLEEDVPLATDGGAPGSRLDGAPPGASELLALLATSGTSGTPKLAKLSRRAFLASARATIEALAITPDDVWLLALPLCHVGGLSVLTRSLLAGTSIVLVPRFSPAAIAHALSGSGPRPTLFPLVPTMLRDWLASPTPPMPSMGLRALIVGGAGCPEDLLDACAARGVLALTTYGLTEACSQLALQRLRGAEVRLRGSGQALPSTVLTIVTPDGEPVPNGVVGEIVVQGPTLFDGYLGQEPRGDRPFFTGDLGHLDAAGQLHVEGRRTDRIVTGGENVAPLEVEAVARTFPGVRDAVVFGVPDERWGEGVAIAVVLDPDATTSWSSAGLDAHLRGRLASFKCPRRFAVVSALPLNTTGKLDRRLARALFTPEAAPLAAG